MKETPLQIRSPWQSLVHLLLLTFVWSIGIQVLAIVVGSLSGGGLFDGGNLLDQSPFFRYLILAAGTFGTFYLPSVLLQKREPYNDYFPYENKSVVLLCILGVAMLVAVGPVMERIGEWNAHMSLPESWKGIEEWMRQQEDAANEVVKKVAMVDNIGFLFLNLIVLAVLPAIAEEYYFRGVLMHIILRIAKNGHVAVWLTAIIFSAIHVQFFGFFPRMILGVLFGYMLLWSRNMWVPIVAHFVNNATVTILAYYYTVQGKTFEELQSFTDYPLWMYGGSIVLTIMVVVLFYNKTKNQQEYGERMG